MGWVHILKYSHSLSKQIFLSQVVVVKSVCVANTQFVYIYLTQKIVSKFLPQNCKFWSNSSSAFNKGQGTLPMASMGVQCSASAEDLREGQ